MSTARPAHSTPVRTARPSHRRALLQCVAPREIP